MESWIDIAKGYGLPGLIILAVGAFWYFKAWPLLVKQLDQAQVEREASSKRSEEQGKLFAEVLQAERIDSAKRFEDQGKIFMDALRTQQVFASETHKEIMAELRRPPRRRRS